MKCNPATYARAFCGGNRPATHIIFFRVCEQLRSLAGDLAFNTQPACSIPPWAAMGRPYWLLASRQLI